MTSLLRQSKRTVIGIIGITIVLLGSVMIPYPGPGWLVVFLGLGVLGTEFDWAKRLLGFAKTRYDRWNDWQKRQGVATRAAFWLLTALVVVVTIWLVNGYGILDNWLDLNQDWLHSPIGFLEFLER